MVFVIKKCKVCTHLCHHHSKLLKNSKFSILTLLVMLACFALIFSSDQNWPHWHHLTEQL